MQCEVHLDLIEAAHGADKTIKFHRHSRCECCGGSGAKPGTKAEPCRFCGGQGRVVQSSGIFSMQTTCPGCQGTGRRSPSPAANAAGRGYVLGNSPAK